MIKANAPLEACQADPHLGHLGRQTDDEIQWFEDDVCRAVSVRRLELVADVSVRRERQALVYSLLTVEYRRVWREQPIPSTPSFHSNKPNRC